MMNLLSRFFLVALAAIFALDSSSLAETKPNIIFVMTDDQGYGDLKGKAFRVGHMGDHSAATLAAFLDAL